MEDLGADEGTIIKQTLRKENGTCEQDSSDSGRAQVPGSREHVRDSLLVKADCAGRSQLLTPKRLFPASHILHATALHRRLLHVPVGASHTKQT